MSYLIKKESNPKYLGEFDFANMFNLYSNLENLQENELVFNLASNLYFLSGEKDNPNLIKTYTVKEQDSWSLISFNLYGTVKLWWLLCKLNNVIDPTETLQSSTKIKYLEKSNIQTIIQQIKS